MYLKIVIFFCFVWVWFNVQLKFKEKMFSSSLFQIQSMNLGYIFPTISRVLVKKNKLRLMLPFIMIYPFSFVFKKHIHWKFSLLIDICIFDTLKYKSRYGVVFNLSSVHYNYNLQLITYIKEQTSLYSLVSLFKNANWVEREIWDMFGIYFKNHPDLRRILNDYTFSWFPLKKDFPLIGYYELFYNDATKIISMYNVNLLQEIRNFEFID